MQQHQRWMAHAMALAAKAEQLGEVPCGAVLVLGEQIIAEGYNRCITDNDPTAHAEIQVLRQAGKVLDNYRLLDTTLYITLEPCPMCAGAIVHGRVGKVVFGAPDLKTGAAGTVMNLLDDPRLNHWPEVIGGVMQAECGEQLSAFFRRRRAEKKALKQAQRSGLGSESSNS
ncbi:tRNA adenosine(34) deaminase TadA [uncultured Ferrimonas sp.]|uniref:tRNA adenosine(34) deaminase TadA n=1 Tax=uncultured Ferrimonas sp. TaxID=432640 RepID=UPI002627ED01|nr:tRNA adenosine(34) deaminase TadA [uncultured Ferrimonas sp.]